MLVCYFFFSSRRRHTRWTGDWSSDVCSSDLTEVDLSTPGLGLQIGVAPGRIDVLTKISGVTFDEVWQRRVQADFGEGVRRSEERRVGKECRSRWWAEH